MTEQPSVWSYDPEKGRTNNRKWRGPKTAASSITSTLQATGYTFTVTDLPGGLCEIDAKLAGVGGTGDTPPTVSDVVDTWELQSNLTLKDICESDCSVILALTNTELAELKYYAKNRPNPADTPAWSGGANQAAVRALLDAGIESWEIEQPILTHTYSVPRGVIYPFTYTNVRKIYSTAQLINTEGVPSDYVLDLAAIAAMFPDPTRTDAAAMVYGWRKMFPTQSIGVGGKREVHMEFKFGLWPTLLYATV